LRELAAAIKQQAGAESLDYAAQLAALGLNLLKQQKPADADPMLRASLTIRQQRQADSWSTFNTQALLGGALAGQQKYAEGEPLLLAGYQGMKEREKDIPANAKVRLTEALERLVQLYDAWGKPEQAKEWRQKLEEAKGADKEKTK
jgi:hypothetical protein